MINSGHSLSEQFTLAIITSRDLEQSLIEIFKFMKKHLPLHLLSIFVFNARNSTYHFQVIVTDEGVMFVDEKFKISPACHKRTIDTLDTRLFSLEIPSEDPVSDDMSEYFGISEPLSTVRVLTSTDTSHHGIATFSAWGVKCFKKKHFAILDSLYEVLTGALRHLLEQLELTNQRNRLTIQNKELRDRIANRIVGEASGLKEVMTQVNQLAPLNIPVLLLGETGVGKEIIANAIHHRSGRVASPLVCFNCGAVPESLLESELFGHEKGAFTGAKDMKHGYFEQADGGTVFMDEIGELSLKAQTKLLRVLQTMVFQRVGGNHPISVDVRVVAATNRDIEDMVRRGKFREDLWYRLNVYPIQIPPLRERRDDIPELASYFARVKSMEMNFPGDFSFSPESMEKLQAYHWPGNVRELQNVIERELIVSRGKPLAFSALTPGRKESRHENPVPTPSRFPTMDEVISQHIKKSLVLSKGKIDGPGGAAELLGMNPSTLRGRMRKLGIKVDRISLR